MSETENGILKQARDALSDILSALPDAKLEWDTHLQSDRPGLDGLADFTLSLRTQSRLDTLVVEFANQGHPQQLRKAIDHLLRFRHRGNRGADHLVVSAPFITKEGAAVCKEEAVGYYDLAGNCRLVFGSYYIERTGAPNPFRKDAVIAPNFYGAKSERVLRVLFSGSDWKVVPLADQAKVSTGTVSIVRNLLLEREWAKEGPAGLRLTHPQKLLKDWASVWQRRREKPQTYFTLLPLARVEEKMAEFARAHSQRFALTGTAGAWRLAPMTRYVRTQVYLDGDVTKLADQIGLKSADSGANVHIFSPRDEGVFFYQTDFEGVPVVSPLQLYLDLQRDPARGEEAADHIWVTNLFPNDVFPAN